MSHAQPWIHSARFDGWLILSPAIIITALVVFCRQLMGPLNDVPPWLWLLLIVGVDVSHVYSTLFRTYLDREELKKRQGLYVLTPLLAWMAGCFLYSINSLLFWRVLAYLAVFHFIRQQYGFMMIYARNERRLPIFFRWLDKAVIYLATLYPLIYWHCHGRTFEWFIEEDFFLLNAPWLHDAVASLYAATLAAYVVKEIIQWKHTGGWNLPKNILLFGTACSWFVGIVMFNNDLAFTATNVIAHGIPYLALIWLYGHNQTLIQGSQSSYLWKWIGLLFRGRAVPWYIAILCILAFLEEGLWDGLIWREHASLFGVFSTLPVMTDTHILVWLVPLLALPQMTHYILDAFIWRMNTENTPWKRYLFHQEGPTT
jgi:hypothetical protein